MCVAVSYTCANPNPPLLWISLDSRLTSRFGPSRRIVEIFNFPLRPSEIKWVSKCVLGLVTHVPSQIHDFYGYPWTPGSTSRFGPSRRIVEIFNFLLRPSEIKWVSKCVLGLVTHLPSQIHDFHGYPWTPGSTSRFGPSRRFVEIFNFLLRPSEIK